MPFDSLSMMVKSSTHILATSDRIWLDQSLCRLVGAVGRQHSLLCQGLKGRSTSSPARRKAQPSNSGTSHSGSNDIVSVVSASPLGSNYRLSLQGKEGHSRGNTHYRLISYSKSNPSVMSGPRCQDQLPKQGQKKKKGEKC